MEPLTDVRDISRIAYAFMASKALFAGLHLALFDKLAEVPQDLDALSSASGAAPNRLYSLLTALVSLGLMVKEGERYANAPATDRYLVRGRAAYFSDYYTRQIDRLVYPKLDHLTPAMKGEAVDGLYDHEFADPEEAADFTIGQHAGSEGPAYMLARRVDLSGRRRVLDVGGGSGAFSLEICRTNPEVSATVLDFPNVVGYADRFAAEGGLADRITTLAGNALETDWPNGHDVVLMSYLLTAVSRPAVDALLARAWSALPSGGLVLVHDFLIDDAGTGPDLAALWYLPMMLGNPDSSALTESKLTGTLARLGFVGVESEELISEIASLVVARKP